MSDNEKFADVFNYVLYDTAMLIKYCADIDVRVKKEKEGTNMCKAIEDMKEEAREEERQKCEKEKREERQESLNKFCVALQLLGENLISTDKAIEMIKLPIDQFQNAVNEIRLEKNNANA